MFIQAHLPLSGRTIHLGGSWKSTDLAHDVYQEHLRIIDDLYDGLKARDARICILERDNAELKARLQALHQRQFRPRKKKDAQTGGKEVEVVHRLARGKRKNAGHR